MQINVELPDAEAKRIKKDVVELNVTLNAYVLEACRRFLDANIAQRRLHFEDKKHHRKILGRKLILTVIGGLLLLNAYQFSLNLLARRNIEAQSRDLDRLHMVAQR